jgi:hypothetical protein
MSSSQATHQDAELILKLYDLRREPVMREARNFVVGFAPKSVDEILAYTNAFGSKENAYLRQVYGYWEMVAAFVVHGTLNALLVYDTCQEMYFAYGKIQPFLQEFRQKAGVPDFLSNLQKVVEGSAEGRERLARVQKRQAEMAAAATRSRS